MPSSCRTRRNRAVALLLTGLPVAAALACSSSSDSPLGTGSADAAVTFPVADVVVGPRDADPIVSAVRVGNMIQEFGGVDLCYREVSSGPFIGPLLRGTLLADAGATDANATDGETDTGPDSEAGTATNDDAGADAQAADAGEAGSDAGAPVPVSTVGLLPFTLTNYLTLSGSGTYELAVVRGDATGCGERLATGTITADPGKLVTVLIASRGPEVDAGLDADAGERVRLVALVDDPRVDESRARVRMVHVLPGAAALTVALARPSGTSLPLVNTVLPNKAGSEAMGPPEVDALGYARLAPVAPPVNVSVYESADSAGLRFAFGGDFGLSAASLHTGYIAGTAKAPRLVWCSDKSVVGKRLDCTTYVP
jgi:hypothetical protein